MSVVLKCVKCNGVLERATLDPAKLWCPRCAVEFDNTKPQTSELKRDPSYEEQSLSLLREILDELRAFNS